MKKKFVILGLVLIMTALMSFVVMPALMSPDPDTGATGGTMGPVAGATPAVTMDLATSVPEVQIIEYDAAAPVWSVSNQISLWLALSALSTISLVLRRRLITILCMLTAFSRRQRTLSTNGHFPGGPNRFILPAAAA